MTAEQRTTVAASGEPKYYRLKKHLLELTRAQPPGTPVPPERALAGEFGMSRTTARQALQELVYEGRLERIQGRGTFVARPKVARSLQLASYTEDMKAQGREAASRLVGVDDVAADRELAERLAVAPGAPVVRVVRLRLADAQPMAIEATHLSARRFPYLRNALARHGSLHAALGESYDVHVAETEETIETAPAGFHEAELLGTDAGTPLLLLFRQGFDAGGDPVEWVRSVYRGDRHKFVARFRRLP